MPILKENEEYYKCNICAKQAFYRCAICHTNYCYEHIRFGRLYGYKISTKNEYYCVACWRIERNNILKYKTTKIEMLSGFRKLGIEEGNSLLIQSSVSSFGYIEDGAESLIDILLMIIGKKGAMVMPAFTPDADYFHPVSSRAHKSCGILCELFRKRKSSVRSNNPSLSFSAKGKLAVQIINNAIQYDKINENSPAARIMNKNGKVLMLGVEFNNNIPLILAENIFTGNNSCGKNYFKFETIARRLKSYKEMIIGEALCRSININEMVSSAGELLKNNSKYFKCLHSACSQCNVK